VSLTKAANNRAHELTHDVRLPVIYKKKVMVSANTAAASSPPDSGGKKSTAVPPNSPTTTTTTKASVSFASSSVVIPSSVTMTTTTTAAAERGMNNSRSGSVASSSPFLDALSQHRVQAAVIDLDHYRIHGGMAVETDYIVRVQQQPDIVTNQNTTVQPEEQPEFDAFLISKTFSAFRTMAHQLKKAADAWAAATAQQQQQQQHGGTSSSSQVNQDAAVQMAQYCELVSHLVDAQRTTYMGKVNYRYVKVLAKNRTTLINHVLQATCANYMRGSSNSAPSGKQQQQRENDHHQTLVSQVARIIETFFLTDHCCSDEPQPVATTTAAAATSASASGGGSSTHHILGAAMGKIVTTVEDGVAAAAQKTRELTRTAGGGGTAGTTTTTSTGGSSSGNPLGWLPFLDHNKEKKDGATAATVGPTAATDDDAPRTAATSAARGSGGGAGQRRVSLVVPLTRKDRRSELLRAHDEEELSTTCQDSARLLLDEHDTIDDAAFTKTNTTTSSPSNNNKHPSSPRDAPSQQQHQSVGASSKIGKFLQRNPAIVMFGIGAVAVTLLKQASLSKVIIDADMALLVIFACYCLGLHTPRPLVGGSGAGGFDDSKPRHMMLRRGSGGGMAMLEDRSGRKLLARSMKAQRRNSTSTVASIMSGSGHPTSPVGTGTSVASNSAHDNDDDDVDCDDHDLDDPSHSGTSYGMGDIMGSPMSMFPAGAKIGSVTNCWGFSDYEDFQVRGATYLQDKQKVASGEYLFPVRGVDLFLTDTCPENVGANAGIFGGHMRTVPTFVVNFRLPWGVLIFYFEIPAKFVPYLQLCYEPDDVSPETKAHLMQGLNDMTAVERCAARFLMKDQNHKNQTFKIIPYVVNGPWVVRQVVGGKPALIGNKLPISWVYQSAENTPATIGGRGAEQKACYLEADLDIAASSAARSILSVARTYCQVLTLDLGFVVQGNTEDELPEQMLVGCRLHGIDPLTSPSFPMSTHNNLLFDVAGGGSGDGSDDENSSHFGRTG
jgi:hypothetical protein